MRVRGDSHSDGWLISFDYLICNDTISPWKGNRPYNEPVIPRHDGLSRQERELYSRARQLLNESGLIRGNLVEMRRVCGKKTCHCRSDPEKKHRSLYLSLSVDGKPRMVYIPSDWEKRVREWASRYARLRDLLGQISLRSLEKLQKRGG